MLLSDGSDHFLRQKYWDFCIFTQHLTTEDARKQAGAASAYSPHMIHSVDAESQLPLILKLSWLKLLQCKETLQNGRMSKAGMQILIFLIEWGLFLINTPLMSNCFFSFLRACSQPGWWPVYPRFADADRMAAAWESNQAAFTSPCPCSRQLTWHRCCC